MKYPIIICRDADPVIYYYSKEETLRKTSRELLAKNIWENVTIVDSSGSRYVVDSVKEVGLRGLFGWNPLLKGTSIWVEFQFSEQGNISLNSLKDFAIESVDRTSDLLIEAWDIDELKDKIKNAQSYEEVISYFK